MSTSYTPSNNPAAQSRGTSATIRAEFDLIDAGFTSLESTVAGKASLDSPALIGTPTAPTATAGTNNTQLATTAYVDQASFSSALPTQGGYSGRYLYTDGVSATWEVVYPDQTGNTGKFLTTNGSATSWASPLPVQTSNSGKVLTTNGTDASWATPFSLAKGRMFFFSGF